MRKVNDGVHGIDGILATCGRGSREPIKGTLGEIEGRGREEVKGVGVKCGEVGEGGKEGGNSVRDR